MKIEIKSIRGRTLYVAEARNVREAVEEAVRAGADLTGADLANADLAGANITGANLTDADLRAAYLRHANLRAANLRAAYLTGADLRDANLAGANLGDAYLGAAYLRGAYLTDANLGAANLTDANLGAANLAGAYLRDANLRAAYLRDANLGGADLRDADLGGAYLTGANLADANLAAAYLGGAYLGGAKGLAPERVNDFLILQDQVGQVRAYKLVDANGEGPFYGGITYRVGETYEAEADTDEQHECGAGINLATLPWCLRNWRKGYRILICEFTASDIAAIPCSDGKFRVSRCKVVDEVDQADISRWLGAEYEEAERE